LRTPSDGLLMQCKANTSIGGFLCLHVLLSVSLSDLLSIFQPVCLSGSVSWSVNSFVCLSLAFSSHFFLPAYLPSFLSSLSTPQSVLRDGFTKPADHTVQLENNARARTSFCVRKLQLLVATYGSFTLKETILQLSVQ